MLVSWLGVVGEPVSRYSLPVCICYVLCQECCLNQQEYRWSRHSTKIDCFSFLIKVVVCHLINVTYFAFLPTLILVENPGMRRYFCLVESII